MYKAVDVDKEVLEGAIAPPKFLGNKKKSGKLRNGKLARSHEFTCDVFPPKNFFIFFTSITDYQSRPMG